MSGYTKGPWDIVKTRQGAFTTIMSEKNAHIAEMVKWYTTDPELVAEMEANGKLISAAPDLFEALNKMLDHFEGSIPLFLFEMAEAAIAKAKGTEQ